MIPLRPAALFRSRWAALVYAAGVLWFATDVAGTPDAPTNNADVTASGPIDGTDLSTLEAQVHALEAKRPGGE